VNVTRSRNFAFASSSATSQKASPTKAVRISVHLEAPEEVEERTESSIAGKYANIVLKSVTLGLLDCHQVSPCFV
jgi:hypothetical protein